MTISCLLCSLLRLRLVRWLLLLLLGCMYYYCARGWALKKVTGAASAMRLLHCRSSSVDSIRAGGLHREGKCGAAARAGEETKSVRGFERVCKQAS